MYSVFILYGMFAAACLLILIWILSYETQNIDDVLEEDNKPRKTYIKEKLKVIKRP